MLRRFHVQDLSSGVQLLDAVQSRHLRDVLRIGIGQLVELFDDSGRVAEARVRTLAPAVELEVGTVRTPQGRRVELIVAAAVPKGPRADWMIEKLSELGAARFIPLQSARSVVIPESGKRARWSRIAEESAKQCRRSGVMQIDEVLGISELCTASADIATRWCLSTGMDATPAMTAVAGITPAPLIAAVGPEGGWTDKELSLFTEASFLPVALTRTILRIETAAVALASVVMLADNARKP